MQEEKLNKEMQFFTRNPLFKGWGSYQLTQIYKKSASIYYGKGNTVFAEGDEGRNVFVVKEGVFVV
jgi:hypothetical protein